LNYGIYFLNHLEVLGDALKNITPNLKKKKEDIFEKLKQDVIKPLKETVKTVSEFF
jgi:hypothetical protein